MYLAHVTFELGKVTDWLTAIGRCRLSKAEVARLRCGSSRHQPEQTRLARGQRHS
jgi:hypothetical protein